MTVVVYGIRNCDTMKKAFAWLDAHGVAYDFHDYKKLGASKAKLTAWCREAGWQRVLNAKGPTFRKLPDADTADLDQGKAIALMLSNPSMIKRPIVETDGGLDIGFSPASFAVRFGG